MPPSGLLPSCKPSSKQSDQLIVPRKAYFGGVPFDSFFLGRNTIWGQSRKKNPETIDDTAGGRKQLNGANINPLKPFDLI